MINGAHIIIYSTDAEADRAFFRDVLGLAHVDAGEGWLIFALRPAEVAVHPAEGNDRHELYLICDDIRAFVKEMQGQSISCSPIEVQCLGLLIHIRLPGGPRGDLRAAPRPAPSMGAAASVARSERVLLAAADEAGKMVGTDQVLPNQPEHQLHRGGSRQNAGTSPKT